MNAATEVYSFILTLNPLVTALIGFVSGLVILLWRFRGHHPKLCNQARSDMAQSLKLADKKVADLTLQTLQLETQLAVSTSELQQLEKSESNLNLSRKRIDELHDEIKKESAENARAQQLCEKIPELDAELQSKIEEICQLTQKLSHLNAENTELSTRMEEERKSSAEKLKILENAEQKLTAQFESLANKILDEKAKKFTEQNSVNLNHLLNPLREQLGEFRKKVDDVYVNDSKDRASLRDEIKGLRLRAEKISQDAINLTQALKGDKKTQGNWGELILEKVLEQSGLRKGIEYKTQSGFKDADNNLFKPDVIVHLPEHRNVIIDSKVSLVAYEKYVSSDDESIQEQALKQHTQSIRKHIKELTNKNYSDLEGIRSLDFVLMFMPIEAAFSLAFQHEAQLFNEAFKNRIVVVSPTTLLATLRTIDNIWRIERQNENAKSIADKAGSIYDKLCGFVEDLEKLGSQLRTAQKTYEGVMNKLTLGKGNLIRMASDFIEQGVKVKKQLPKSMTEKAVSGGDEPPLEVVRTKPSGS